jgi:hypothetical protein
MRIKLDARKKMKGKIYFLVRRRKRKEEWEKKSKL